MHLRSLLVQLPGILLALGCGRSPAKEPVQKRSTETDVEITRSILSERGKTVLKATFRNLTSSQLAITVRQMDLNLYEPTSHLPITLSVRPGKSETITLNYPAAAGAPKSAAEKALTLPGFRDANDASLNCAYDYTYSTGHGSSETNEMEPPDPGFRYSPPRKGNRGSVAVTNDHMLRTLDFRLLSVHAKGLRPPKTPIDLKVPGGGSTQIADLSWPQPNRSSILPMTLKYGFRLQPNKKWRIRSTTLN